MEKILEKKIAPLFTVKTESPSYRSSVSPKQKKKFKFFQKLEEAFRSFDENTEEDSTPYLIKELPPIPTEGDVKQYLLRNALLLIDNGEFKMALHILGDILKKDSYFADAVRWMGWCFKQEGDQLNALKCYNQLISLRQTDQDYFELGEIYYELKNDEKARDIWLEGLKVCRAESPRLFDLHKNLGNAYMRLGDLESAEENYNKAHTLREMSDALQVNLGSMHFYRRDLKNSLECFKKAVEINPYNDRAWCGVGLVAREMKDPEWANSMVIKSLDLNPDNLISLQVLVSWAMEDKIYNMAIERVHHYSYMNQNDVPMIFTLAGLHFQNGAKLEAEMELERLLAQEPEHEDAIKLISILRTEQNG
jgi:tetratricopeptide (TPR) repeat protein